MVCVALCAACGADGYSGPTVTVTGNVHEYKPDGYMAPIPGTKVCVLDEPSIECAFSDMAGTYELPGAPVGETALVIEAESYASSVATVTLDADATLGTRLITRNDLLFLAAVSGVTLKSGLGLVVLQFHGATGVTASIAPIKGQGPIYFNEQQVPDTSLPSTTTSGLVAFTNLPPGDYTVGYALAGSTFMVDAPGGWREGDGSRIPVIADAISGMTIAVQF